MILSDICIKRPVFATVLSLMLLAIGGMFYSRLQIRGLPAIDQPVITVQSGYTGASAFYMEQQVTNRIEDILKTVKGLDYMLSYSREGGSNVVLIFKLETDIEVALNDIRSKVSSISRSLPDNMPAPAVSKMDSNSFPSMWLSISSDRHDQLELTRIAKDNIDNVLGKLPAVGNSFVYGGNDYFVSIEPIMSQVYRHKIAPTEIERAVIAQNKDYPAGFIKTESKNISLSLIGSLNSAEQFRQIIVKKYPDNSLVRLADISNINLAPTENDVILRYNGKRAMALGLVMQSNSNVLELSKTVRQEVEKIEKSLPKGVKIEIAYDAAIPVKASIKAVFFTIFEALILVVLVTYVFLGSVRITLIPFVTIPISLIATFSVMYLFNFSINTFTLLAMILAIGLVVDDAIVMLENIFRHHHELGKSSLEAAFSGSREIGFAIIAMTFTLVAVFLPIGFIQGFIGKLFIEFAWTLAFCVLFSGFVALTLTPMMASKLVGFNETRPLFLEKFEQYLNLLQEKYLYYLNIAFGERKKFALLASSSIILLVISFIYVNKEFEPQEDQSMLQVIFSGPEGSSVERSERTVKKAEEIFASHKDIKGFFQVIGWGGGDNAMAFVPLKEWDDRKKSQEQIRQELNAKLWQIPGMTIFAINPPTIGGGGGGDKVIQFNLQSSGEYLEIDVLSQKFMDLMKATGVFVGIERDYKASTPTVDIQIDREKAYLYGVSLDNIGKTIQYLIAGQKIGDFRLGNNIYDVTLRFNQGDRRNIVDLRKILVKSDNNIMLPLETVANLVDTTTIKSYNHYNNSKAITISADLSPGKKLPDAITAIDKISSELVNPNTTKLEYLGEIKNMKQSDSNSLMTFMLALLFIYLVLAAQFESFGDPLLILMAVPFSITGGVLALWIFGNSVNMYSNIGLVTLIGLVTKNSIMLVEFANQLRQHGMKVQEAIMESAKLRLRPILMTSVATIFGAVPLAFASGAGAGARNSIGLVVVGGMLVGTVFTLFVIPVLYQSFKKDKPA